MGSMRAAVRGLRGLAVGLLLLGGVLCGMWWWKDSSPVFAPQAGASLRVVKLASVEWPPYTSAAMPGNGVTAMVLRKALEAAGMELRIDFLPWARLLETVREDTSYAGFFPEYPSAEREAQYLYSAPIGKSALCFMERTGHPIAWETLDDLRETPIGVVHGYVNSQEFDAMAAQGRLRTEAVVDDATNIRKIISGRLTLAIIDPLVLNHLLRYDKSLASQAGKVRAQPRILEQKTLHVCLRKSPEGEAVLQAVNAALAGFDPLAEQKIAVDSLRHAPSK